MISDTTSFIQRFRALGLTGLPMNAEQIARLETHLGLPIPSAYRAYLAIAGVSPSPALVGSDCHDHYLFDLRESAVKLLQESGNPFSLPEDAIVFLMHQGYQFFYFRADGVTNDPAVYYYFEDRSAPEFAYESFSDWVAAIA
jgi:hypothetical protein